MKQKEVFNKIGDIIQELNDQYEYLKTVRGDLNDLELELFVSNAHFLTNNIEILSKLNLQNSKFKNPIVEKTETAHEPKYFEPVVQQMKHVADIDEDNPSPLEQLYIEPAKNNSEDELPVSAIDLEPASQADTYSFIREEPETIRHELVLDEAATADDENLSDENEESNVAKSIADMAVPDESRNGVPEATEAKPAPNKPEPEMPIRAPEDEVFTINQKISSQLGDKAIARTEELSGKPISDIKPAITLNDKLLYVKDLFNGYNLAYSEAIEILNRFNTFEEAMRFLRTNYVTKNNWESKPETTEKFYALLKRRYA